MSEGGWSMGGGKGLGNGLIGEGSSVTGKRDVQEWSIEKKKKPMSNPPETESKLIYSYFSSFFFFIHSLFRCVLASL